MKGSSAALPAAWRPLVARPLPPLAAALLYTAALWAGAAYCMGYAALSGTANEWARAIGWSTGAVLPWVVAFEGVKRWEARHPPLRWVAIGVAMLATGLLSLGLEIAIDRWVWNGHLAPLGLTLLRRLPAIGIFLLLLAARRGVATPQAQSADEGSALAPTGLRYVRAADNYVELHYAGGMRMERATLSAMERRLRRHGFIRVHRSILVHPRHVGRLEAGGRSPALLLDDGTRLPTGERYRAAIRHFVP